MLVRSRRESRKRSNGICLTGGGSVDEVVLADEDLALAMQSGNDVAFEALVHRYHGALVGYLYRMCHDYHLAEDAAQESFVRSTRPSQDTSIQGPLRRISSQLRRIVSKTTSSRHMRGE